MRGRWGVGGEGVEGVGGDEGQARFRDALEKEGETRFLGEDSDIPKSLHAKKPYF